MLRLNGVGRRFPNNVIALDNITTRIEPGAFIALLGPSGCGKSTLLRILAGLDTPDTGSLTWDDNTPPGPGDIGFVFQDATLLPWANAEANVFLPLRLAGKSLETARPIVRDTLAQLGLAGFEHAKPTELSGGMRMRVSIARALVSRPKLLLMDEPFAALDEFTRHRLQDDLFALWREARTTIVFVTHSIYEAAYLASRIIVMSPRPGRIAAELTCTLPDTNTRRTDPAYAALTTQVTETLRAVMPA
ncbi:MULTISPECIES: ABC transporter ATP-binding protein [Acidiphilium]|uniref:NitT/TauT family transport system ATP-binding protein n=1 Tax=Acidiphilium rubrum TaxID=526 RepID=A0A8G2CNH6_ACIRU|nr:MULTISPECIES: ABC transporter ATP-binding protein [Acidiphilium]SIR44279.1 NitT/TauT family transport system ATP-binding protein [Acidiphilium rubrum]